MIPIRRVGAILKSQRLQLAGIVAIAFAVRGIFLVRGGSKWALNDDSNYYLALARGLLHGCGFAFFYDRCGPLEVLRTPGYPAFLIPFHSHYRAVVFVQALIGASVCFAVASFTAKRYAGSAAVIAAAFIALDVPTILLTKEVMTEALFQFLAVIAVFAALEGAGILSGVLLGASIFVRPVGLVLLPIAVIALLFRTGWQGACAALGISLLVILGWLLRNGEQAGVFTLTVEGTGNLFWYTAPAVIARHDRLSSPVAIEESLERAVDAKLGVIYTDTPSNFWGPVATSEGSRLMLSEAIGVIRTYPIDAMVITLNGFEELAYQPYQLQTGWHGFIKNRRIFEIIRAVSTVGQSVMLLMLWVGVFWSLWKVPRSLERWLLFSTALLLLLAASPFQGNINARFRSPAIPFLAVLAGIGLGSRPKGDSAAAELEPDIPFKMPAGITILPNPGVRGARAHRESV